MSGERLEFVARRAHLLCLLTITFLLSLSPGLGRAQTDTALADSLFKTGRALMAEGKFKEACAKFKASLQIEESSGTLLNLARCHELQGKIATAWKQYQQTVDLAAKRKESKREEAAKALVEKLAPRVSWLTIVVTTPITGQTVTQNDHEVAAAHYGQRRAVDPGSYRVAAKAPGRQDWQADVKVNDNADDKTVTVPVLKPKAVAPPPPPTGTALPPPPPPPPAEQPSGSFSRWKIAGIVMAISGGVATGISVDFAVQASDQLSDAESDKDLCPGKVCTPEGRVEVEAARDKATVFGALIIGGAVLAAGGIVLVIVGPPNEPEPTAGSLTLVPQVGPASAGFTFAGAF